MRRFRRTLAVLALAVTAFAQEPAGVVKHAGYRGFRGYIPSEPKSLDEIPADIRAKVVAHLKARLGDAFFAQLTFVGGQIVDFEAVKHAPRGPPAPGERFHKYDLHFRFERPELGIAGYEAQIKLNPDGSLFAEIDLPAFREHPEKLRLLPLEAAGQLARQHGAVPPLWRTELGYSVEHDSIFWRFSKQTSGTRTGGKILHVDISAHDGSLLKVSESSFMQ